MQIQSTTLVFNDIKIPARWAPRIRGFIASKYPHYIELHHHNGKKFIYHYPLVQYKIIDKTPIMVGIGEAVEIIIKIFTELDKLNLSVTNLDLNEKSITLENVRWEESDIMREYRLVTPWMALNQKNFQRYMNNSADKKKELLEKIFVGNILSISKTLGYTIRERLRAEVDLFPVEVKFKQKAMLAFKGRILVNFHVPDLWGLGKSVSRGFGTVVGKS